MHNNEGYGHSTQDWVWNNIGTVLSALGARQPRNRTAKTSFTTKIASNNVSNLKIAANSSENDLTETITDNSSKNDIIGKIDNTSIANTSVGTELKDYLDEIEEPFLYNESGGKENDNVNNNGDNPVISYNDLLGPFTINWDDTNRNKNFGDNYAVSKLTRITINYLDGEPDILDIEDKNNTSNIEIVQEQNGVFNTFKEPYKINKNKPFYIKNPDLEREVTSVKIHLKKVAEFQTAHFQRYNGTTSDIKDKATAKTLIRKKLMEDPYTKRGYPNMWNIVVTSVELDEVYKPQNIMFVSSLTLEGTAELDLEIGVLVKKGDIELTKEGTYNDQHELLPNVKFAVYCNEIGKYVKDIELVEGSTTQYRTTFTEKLEEAKVYTTDENGKVLIENLYAGKDDDIEHSGGGYSYKLVEIDAGDNTYYIDPHKLARGESTHKETTTSGEEEKLDPNIATGHVDVDDKQYCVLDNVTPYYDNIGGTKGKGQRVKTYVTIEDDRSSGDLTIEKADETFPDEVKLKGAEFKIKLVRSDNSDEPEHDLGLSNLWLKLPPNSTDGHYDYNDLLHDEYLGDEASSATFVTDEDGKIDIKCIINGTYHIYETKASIGYDITKQYNYGKDPDHPTWVDYGEITITTGNNHLEPQLLNRKIAAKLEGEVWLDVPATNKKATEYDGLIWTHKDTAIDPGITVNLKDEAGNLMATTITDGNGYWSIDKKINNTEDKFKSDIYYWDLTNAFVEFIYDNQKYVCVDPFVGGAAQVKENSKAKEYLLEERELDDRNLTGVEGNCPGIAVTKQKATTGMTPLDIIEFRWDNENFTLPELGLTGYYNVDNFTVENINLGLWEKIPPTYSILESLQYSKVSVNGYTYTYDYVDGTTGTIDSSMVPVTYRQTGAKHYGAKVYPSDIAYTVEGRENGIQMYVVYKINVTNSTTTKLEDIYDEVRLYLTSLTNTFNSYKYEISTDHTGDANWQGSQYFGFWEKSEDNLANYRIDDDGSVISGDKLSDGIKPGETESVYVQFKVQEQFLKDILAGTIPEGEDSYAVSVAHSIGHHVYTRTDNVWTRDEKEGSATYYKDSREVDHNETTGDEFLHRSLDYPEDAGALGILFSLGEERVISGTVFEDIKTEESAEDNTNLGNGLMDNEEGNRGQEVKVELLNASSNENAILYQRPGDTTAEKVQDKIEKGYMITKAITTTNPEGYYEFLGVTPGVYKLRFTYSNGDQVIMNPDGTKITANDYKSTIINTNEAGRLIQNAEETARETMIENTNIYNNAVKTRNYSNGLGEDIQNIQRIIEWYKYLYNNTPDLQYNVVTDDLEMRSKFETYEYSTEDGKTIVRDEDGNIVDPFPIMESYSPYFSITIENDIADRNNVDLSTHGYGHNPEYRKFNFGLIKTTETTITLDKIISNVKLTNSAGTSLVQDDPRTALNYVTALDDLSEGSKYVRIEMPLEDIFGTALQTTYRIYITNTSVKDYIENREDAHYGYYFKYGDKITGNAYLTRKTVTEVIDILDNDYDLLDDIVVENVEHPEESRDGGKHSETSEVRVTADEEGNRLIFTEWTGIEAGGVTQIDYTVGGIFQEDMDLIYDNNAKITKMKLDYSENLRTLYIWQDYSKTRLIVTPDTGEDRRPTYYVVGAIALVILAIGLIVIRNGILKKDE